MSETSGEMKSIKDGSSRIMARNYYFGERDSNPWPTPPKQSGGAFGAVSGRSSEQPKKFGGGFGGFGGFGGSIGRSGLRTETDLGTSVDALPSSFKQRKETTGFNVSRGGFGVGGGFGGGATSSSRLLNSGVLIEALMDAKSDDRCGTPKPSEASNAASGASRRGGFGNSPRSSEVMSPSKRSRTGRRTGRRGPRGPGHCFHCQEHGHISRECPKKAADTDEFEEGGGGTETSRVVAEEVVSAQIQRTKRTLPLLTSRAVPFLDAKLENQKARESYYAGYGYGKTAGTGGSSLLNSSSTGFESGRSSGMGLGGESIKSPEVDKFSEQLDNALKLHVADPPNQSPRGLTQLGKGGAGGGGAGSRINSNKVELAPIKSNSLQDRDPIKEISSEMLTIETRRIVKREGECHLEETTIINFPRVLPPNVRVITAQFVPVATTQGV